MKELKEYHKVDQELDQDKMFGILMQFFKAKIYQYVQRNRLLLSRWGKLCRNSFDIQKCAPVFRKAQQQLRLEYNDAVDRFERLYEYHLTREQQKLSQKVSRLM